MSTALRAAVLLLPWSVSAQPCAPPVEKTIMLQLPGRPGLPAGSQMKIDMPVTVVPESCPPRLAPAFDALRGPTTSPGTVLHGEPIKPAPKRAN